MNNCLRFKFTDLLILTCILMLIGAVVLPALLCSAGRSRDAVCRNNLKLIGIGLELFKDGAEGYPWWDMPDGMNLRPWPDLLAMQKGYTPEWVEANRSRIIRDFGLNPDGIVKTIDDDKIFLCPSDHPHPHMINMGRAAAWGFNPYEYSYAIASSARNSRFHERADQQVLVPDGLWPWSQNFSGEWVTNPNASWSTPSWFSNTVGYWHKKNSANFLLMDLHVENHEYPPDTNKIFFLYPGEDINIPNY